MNLSRAEDYLKNIGPANTKLADVYDDDEMLRSALSVLFPGFEYPDISYLTLGQLRTKYTNKSKPLP